MCVCVCDGEEEEFNVLIIVAKCLGQLIFQQVGDGEEEAVGQVESPCNMVAALVGGGGEVGLVEGG